MKPRLIFLQRLALGFILCIFIEIMIIFIRNYKWIKARKDSEHMDDIDNSSMINKYFEIWEMNQKDFCSKKFFIYNNEWILMKNVTVMRDYYSGYFKGSIVIECMDIPNKFNRLSDSEDINSISDILKFTKKSSISNENTPIWDIENLTFVIDKIKFNNLLELIEYLYNVFLKLKYLSNKSKFTNILIMDNRLKGKMNRIWLNLFKKIIRTDDLSKYSKFNRLAWIYDKKFISIKNLPVPELEDFQRFLNNPYGGHEKRTVVNNRTINVTFVEKKDCSIKTRDISINCKQDQQVMDYIKSKRKHSNFYTIQQKIHSLDEQIDVLRQTNILFDFTGEELPYIFLVQRQTIFVCLAPKNVDNNEIHKKNIKSIAKTLGIYYISIFNKDLLDNSNQDTKTSFNFIAQLISKFKKK